MISGRLASTFVLAVLLAGCARTSRKNETVLTFSGSALGADTHRVKGDLERFKELVEAHGATGGWRGNVVADS